MCGFVLSYFFFLISLKHSLASRKNAAALRSKGRRSITSDMEQSPIVIASSGWPPALTLQRDIRYHLQLISRMCVIWDLTCDNFTIEKPFVQTTTICLQPAHKQPREPLTAGRDPIWAVADEGRERNINGGFYACQLIVDIIGLRCLLTKFF